MRSLRHTLAMQKLAWRAGAASWRAILALALSALPAATTGCQSGGAAAVRSSSPKASWPADAVFAGYPVIHCTQDNIPAEFLRDMTARGQSEAVSRESYSTTRDLVLTTLNLFLATGRWGGERAQITATRESPRPGAANECRMFELALADEITLRLPPSVSGAPYIAPVAMVGYDYEAGESRKSPPHISVRIAALLARGTGQVLRTVAVVAKSPVTQGVGPTAPERSSQEIAQDLTEQLAKKLSQAIAE